jgi:hypothetical protein
VQKASVLKPVATACRWRNVTSRRPARQAGPTPQFTFTTSSGFQVVEELYARAVEEGEQEIPPANGLDEVRVRRVSRLRRARTRDRLSRRCGSPDSAVGGLGGRCGL